VFTGADVRLGTAVVAAAYEEGLWRLTTNGTGSLAEVAAAAVVNCGGLWADTVDALTSLVDPKGALPSGTRVAEAATEAAATEAAAEAKAATFEVAPRRGDYLIYGAVDAAGDVCAVPVGGVPLRSGGRGPYLWRTVHGDLVCGPTNHPAARPNPGGRGALPPAADDHQAALAAHSARVWARLATARVKDVYAGLRPALRGGSVGGAAPARGDYLVGFDADPAGSGPAGAARRRLAWVTCAGARSTGLTASLAVGNLVTRLLAAPNSPPQDASRGGASPAGKPTADAAAAVVVAAALAAAALHPPIAWPSCAEGGQWALPAPLTRVEWPRLPSLDALAQSFAERNDGCVEIRCTDAPSDASAGGGLGAYPATVRRVTHPQTRFGLATRPPFRPLDHYPALAALVAALSDASPLAFLKAATAASVLRGGYTNALYLVRVPDGVSSGGAATAATPPSHATWVVRKSAAAAGPSLDPLFGVHRICRDAEHLAVAAAAKRGLAPAALFDADASLLAQVQCEGPSGERVRGFVLECLL
jgi:hypothetical protein